MSICGKTRIYIGFFFELRYTSDGQKKNSKRGEKNDD